MIDTRQELLSRGLDMKYSSSIAKTIDRQPSHLRTSNDCLTNLSHPSRSMLGARDHGSLNSSSRASQMLTCLPLRYVNMKSLNLEAGEGVTDCRRQSCLLRSSSRTKRRIQGNQSVLVVWNLVSRFSFRLTALVSKSVCP
jgi:hypothetical protein